MNHWKRKLLFKVDFWGDFYYPAQFLILYTAHYKHVNRVKDMEMQNGQDGRTLTIGSLRQLHKDVGDDFQDQLVAWELSLHT